MTPALLCVLASACAFGIVGTDRLEAAGTFVVDDSNGLGLTWEGVGAISGGGATSKLLYDYPEDAQSQILDFLFKPGVGLDLQILKVEIGGDTDATEGAEPSHMHSQGDEDYTRGYEWWLMKEAKKRNPEIKLYGLPWGWPGGLDPDASSSSNVVNPFVHAETTANYTLAWILGAKRLHNLSIDYVGLWNEKDPPHEYIDALHQAVKGSEMADKTVVLDRLRHYPGANNMADSQGCRQYAEPGSTKPGELWVDEEGSIFDGRSARCLARVLNRNYISLCKTATYQWHLISSFYDYLPWSRCGVAVANEPWSGAFEITSPTWAIAHTTQFAPIGWHYAAHGSGVALLPWGGSMVTRISPDKQDFSIVVEKMDPTTSACARGRNPDHQTAAEDVTIQLKGSFLEAVRDGKKQLHVWYSNLSSATDYGVNPPESQLFQKLEPVTVDQDGLVHLSVQPEELYTLTTLTRGGKMLAASPPKQEFPLPYVQSFDDERKHKPGRFWYDQMGAWEVQKSPYGDEDKRGKVLRQVVPVWPACWGYSCTGPTTFFGPSTFKGDLTVSMDVLLEHQGEITIKAEGLNYVPLVLGTSGTWTMGATEGNVSFAKNTWHTVAFRLLPSGEQEATVDGVRLQAKLSALQRLRGAVKSAEPTCRESDFSLSTVGKKYLRLKRVDAKSEEACRQRCCEMSHAGASMCDVWQYDGHFCEVGNANRFGFERDDSGKWTGGLRGDLPGWHLRVELSRYIYASIDNFKITRNSDAVAM